MLQTDPEAIEQLHYDYYAAGASCATTASYQASYEGFAAIGLSAGETSALLRRSVELASRARDRYRRRSSRGTARVCMSRPRSGPYGAISHDGAEYRGDYGLSVDDLVEFHAKRFAVLASAARTSSPARRSPSSTRRAPSAHCSALHRETRAWISFTSPDGIIPPTANRSTNARAASTASRNVVALGVNCVRPEVVGLRSVH